MNVLRNILILIIFAEVVWAGGITWQQLRRGVPPELDSRRLDPVTAAELEQLRSQVRDGSGAARDWRALAESCLGNGYYVAAEQCFHKAAELDSRDVQARYGRGFCLERVGQTGAAIDVLTATIEYADVELAKTCWYQIGRCHLREENPKLAEAAFRETPGFAPASYQLAKLLIRSGRAGQAVPILERELARLPNSLKLLQLRMHAAEAMGDKESLRTYRDREERGEYKLVLEYGQKFISLFASRVGLAAQLSRAIQVKETGSLQERQAALAGPLRIIRENRLWQYRSVWIAAAHVELGLGNLNSAREIVAEISQTASKAPEVLELQALLAEATDEHETARELWVRLAAMQPSAHFYRQLSESESSVDDAASERHRALADLGEAMEAFRINDVEGARKLLAGGTPVLSRNERYLFYVGESERILGNIPEAIKAYQQCLAIKPEHGRALRRYRELQRKL